MKKLLILPIVIICQSVFCQYADDKSSDVARNKAIDTYHNIINIQSGLYNGVEYSGYLSAIKGSPYYNNTNEWVQGSVFYDGTLYNNIYLKFDMVDEKLIVKRFDGFAIELLVEKLDFFTLGSQFFKHFFGDSVLPNGFYQVLSSGTLNIYAKKTKTFQEKLIENNYIQTVEEKDKYYAVKGGDAVIIKNLNSIFELMNDKQKEVKSYLKKGHINFKKNPEATIIKTAEYYNQAKSH